MTKWTHSGCGEYLSEREEIGGGRLRADNLLPEFLPAECVKRNTLGVRETTETDAVAKTSYEYSLFTQ